MSGSNAPPVITAALFRGLYPAFTDNVAYTDDQVNFWIQLASNVLDGTRWNDFLELGVGLYAAHNLVIMRRDYISATSGGVPGLSGMPNNKMVGKVSTGLDTNNTSVHNGGPWNLTTYGTQFLWYAQIVGSGGIQVTGPIIIPGYPGRVLGVF